MKKLTKKEEEIMNLFWDNGPMYVRELQELYQEPKPHFNTLSTQVRTLEMYGYMAHKTISGSFQYYPAISREEYGGSNIVSLINKCFGSSYMGVVSALVREEKITVDDLKDLIEQIENGK